MCENLLFPDVEQRDFDFKAGWLVSAVNMESRIIRYEGTGKNADLRFEVGFEDQPEFFTEKVESYKREHKELEKLAKERLQAGEITEKEAQMPCYVLEYFPEEMFLEPKPEGMSFEDF